MRERPPLLVLVICAAAAAAAAAIALQDQRHRAFTLGVRPAGVAATVPPGGEICQRPIDVPASADQVRFMAGVPGSGRGAVRVHLAGGTGLRRTAAVAIPRADAATIVAPLPVREGERVGVCIENRGDERVVIYGGPPQAAGASGLYARGSPIPADLSLQFEHATSRSAWSLVPATLERASRFNASWVRPWLLWVVLAALLTLVPVMLAAALRKALREPGPAAPGGDGPV